MSSLKVVALAKGKQKEEMFPSLKLKKGSLISSKVIDKTLYWISFAVNKLIKGTEVLLDNLNFETFQACTLWTKLLNQEEARSEARL